MCPKKQKKKKKERNLKWNGMRRKREQERLGEHKAKAIEK
ncbi:MAG: hypothetical protein US36_C0012G0019 [Candidatus Wolfebacteria bacterium GW2011_GWC1_37_10]|uniref:Uncharacterized protein n=1 Tax=Candidatus Wolfebacteria bacterium GW2011_GWC1_37_10 TaxID=1619010 RepID=A0A0G0G747_9BACT|nr:MAG: hypothetical protein US36_C0012G0019 [Candidatus Wolfebacteria bacterium GW2011_GWC1_37_10]